MVCRRVVGAVAVAAAAVVVGGPEVAQAQTIDYTIHVPALVLNNLCHDNEPVNLSGDLKIHIVTTPRPDGSTRVVSRTVGTNLKGVGLQSQVAYRGVDGERSQSYVNPGSAVPTTSRVKHYTRLFPKSSAINPMYLVIILRETVAANGAALVPTLQHLDLTCHKPRHCGKLDRKAADLLDEGGDVAVLPE
jgi:hypothetical protein